LVILSLVLSSAYLPLFFAYLFWMGGLLIIPSIILIVSFNNFQGSILNKTFLSLLPWSILLILNYIYRIKDNSEVFAAAPNEMIIISLIFGLIITIIYNKFLKPKVKTKKIVDEIPYTESDGKDIYIILGFIGGIFTIIFISSWIYHFITKYIM